MSDWREQAVCRHVHPEVFFPEPSDRVGRWRAAQVCRACPVTTACLAAADQQRERYGVWGDKARNPQSGRASRIATGRPRTRQATR